MKLELSKGMSLDLTKSGDTKFRINLSWDPAEVGQKIDVDTAAFLLSGTPATLNEIRDCVYHQKDKSFESHPSGSVLLSPDSRDGSSTGIDEYLDIDTDKIPSHFSKVAVYINIYAPKVSFNKIKNAKVEVVNQDGSALCVFNMSTQLTDENSLLVGVLNKVGGNWEFQAKGEGYVISDLNQIVASLNENGLV
jgi:stress response protein SCP2